MQKVSINIDSISYDFLARNKSEARTPISILRNGEKGIRYYFKDNIIYSYGEHFPLAKIIKKTLYMRPYSDCNTVTTKKQWSSLHKQYSTFFTSTYKIIYSSDFKNIKNIDDRMQIVINSLIKSRKTQHLYIIRLEDGLELIKNKQVKITKKKFPILFDDKYSNIRTMLFSKNNELEKLAVNYIKNKFKK